MNGALSALVLGKWIRRLSRRNGLIAIAREFENDARMNREPIKRLQKWDTMGVLF